jgi:hypothetical protein
VVAATRYSKFVSVVHPARSDATRGDCGKYNSGDSGVIYNKWWLAVVHAATAGRDTTMNSELGRIRKEEKGASFKVVS